MEYLSPEEKAHLEALRQRDSFVEESLRQLDRILGSKTFRRVQENAQSFLGFVVSKKLLGRDNEIKESTVAIHAFQEQPGYDTAAHGKIRMAAGHLREKLKEYYAKEGRNDPIEFVIDTGSYVPEVRDRRIVIGVSRFENWNPNGDQDYLCMTVSDEIAHELARLGTVHATRVPTLEANHPQLRYGLRGSLECQSDLTRLHVSLSDLRTCRILLGRTFEGQRDELLKVARQAATAIGEALRPVSRGREGNSGKSDMV
jgi:TolB-like protein